MDPTSGKCPAMDTTSGKCPAVGITSGDLPWLNYKHARQYVERMDHGSITEEFHLLSKRFQYSFPTALLQITFLMSNISRALNKKIRLVREGRISLDWSACHYYFASELTKIRILFLPEDLEYGRELYLEDLKGYEKRPGLKDLAGFEAIYAWTNELIKATGDLQLDVSKKISLDSFMIEFFGMIRRRILENYPAKYADGSKPAGFDDFDDGVCQECECCFRLPTAL